MLPGEAQDSLDPSVPFQHKLNYIDLSTKAENIKFLTVLPVENYGHCNFSSDQILGAFTLMVRQATAQTGR
jgi:hypothetical protein